MHPHFTGAPIPAGADRVVIQEEVRRDGDKANIDEDPGKARHIRERGGDFERGDELVRSGRLLDKRAIVAAAAADVVKVDVFKRPQVSIMSTGDELAEPGTAAARPDAIPESVSLGVAALVDEWGGSILGRQRLRDDLSAMEEAAAQAVASSDLALVTGGASVGEKDFAKTMFEPAGLELIFSKVSIKPGKPVWLGRSRGTLVMGRAGESHVRARHCKAPARAASCRPNRKRPDGGAILAVRQTDGCTRKMRPARDLSPRSMEWHRSGAVRFPGFECAEGSRRR